MTFLVKGRLVKRLVTFPRLNEIMPYLKFSLLVLKIFENLCVHLDVNLKLIVKYGIQSIVKELRCIFAVWESLEKLFILLKN
jgi:hypothetical protein